MTSSTTLEKKFSQPQDRSSFKTFERNSPKDIYRSTETKEFVRLSESLEPLNLLKLLNGRDAVTIHFFTNDGVPAGSIRIENKFMPYTDRDGITQKGLMAFLVDKEGNYTRLRDGAKFGIYHKRNQRSYEVIFNIPPDDAINFSGTVINTNEPFPKNKHGYLHIDGSKLDTYYQPIQDLSLGQFSPGVGFDVEKAKKRRPEWVGDLVSHILNHIVAKGRDINLDWFAGDGCNVPRVSLRASLKMHAEIESHLLQVSKDLGLKKVPIIRFVCGGGLPTGEQIAEALRLDQGRKSVDTDQSHTDNLYDSVSQVVNNTGQSGLKDEESRTDGTFEENTCVFMGINENVYLELFYNYQQKLEELKPGLTSEQITELKGLIKNLNIYLKEKSVPLVNGSDKTQVAGGKKYTMYFVPNPSELYDAIASSDIIFEQLFAQLNKHPIS